MLEVHQPGAMPNNVSSWQVSTKTSANTRPDFPIPPLNLELFPRHAGLWFITPQFANEKRINAQEVVQVVRSAIRPQKKGTRQAASLESLTTTPRPSDTALLSVQAALSEPWKNELAKILSEMNPYAFERLAQLLLRESGFSQVTVTRKSGDD